MILVAETLELRGVANKVTKTGKAYLVLNCETNEGEHYALYCPNMAVVPNGLRKGEMINVTLDYKVYNGNEKCTVVHVEKAV